MRALYFTENNWNCPRITHEKRDCRQWFRTYLTYVKDPTWLLNVRDFSLCMTRCHVLASDIVHRGSSLTFPVSNGRGISANYYSTVSSSDMKHRESVMRSSKMYASLPAISLSIGCPQPGYQSLYLDVMRALYFTENNWNCPRITHEKRDCRQWFRTYLTYVKDPHDS